MLVDDDDPLEQARRAEGRRCAELCHRRAAAHRATLARSAACDQIQIGAQIREAEKCAAAIERGEHKDGPVTALARSHRELLIERDRLKAQVLELEAQLRRLKAD